METRIWSRIKYQIVYFSTSDHVMFVSSIYSDLFIMSPRYIQRSSKLPTTDFILNYFFFICKYETCRNRLLFPFLMHVLFIYISNVIPFPSFPSGKSPIPASMRVLPHLPAHPLPTPCPGIPLHRGIQPSRTKSIYSHWCPTRQSSATYAAGAMGPSMCTL